MKSNISIIAVVCLFAFGEALQLYTQSFDETEFFTIDSFTTMDKNNIYRLEFDVQGEQDWGFSVLLTNIPDYSWFHDNYVYVHVGYEDISHFDAPNYPTDEVETPNILSPNEFRSFWIEVAHNSSKIQVGKLGEETPFMTFKWKRSFPIKYFGLSGNPQSGILWRFNQTAPVDVYPAPPLPSEYSVRPRAHMRGGQKSMDVKV